MNCVHSNEQPDDVMTTSLLLPSGIDHLHSLHIGQLLVQLVEKWWENTDQILRVVRL